MKKEADTTIVTTEIKVKGDTDKTEKNLKITNKITMNKEDTSTKKEEIAEFSLQDYLLVSF